MLLCTLGHRTGGYGLKMRRGLIDQDQALGEEGLKHFHDTGEVAGSEPTEPKQLQFLARTNEGHTGFRDGGTVR